MQIHATINLDNTLHLAWNNGHKSSGESTALELKPTSYKALKRTQREQRVCLQIGIFHK